MVRQRTYRHEDRTFLGLTAGEWVDEVVATLCYLGLIYLVLAPFVAA